MRSRIGSRLLAVLAVTAAVTALPVPARAADRVLRVYNNNIENLVVNNSDGSCTRISGPDHLTSMLVDDAGRTGTSGVKAPDILIVQQVRGTGQATAYADQLSAKFGLPAGTYKAIVVWDDPEPWGSTHKCDDQSLGDLKKKQTNGIVYHSGRLTLTDTSKYWSAGWLKPGTAYGNGAGCTLYKPPNADPDSTDQYKWKRTSAIAARFTIKETGTSVFVATMHLPQENRQNACAGDGDKGIGGTGIHLGADATSLMNASTIRIVGIDANRTAIPASTLSGYGMNGYGTAATNGSSKIDYLFVRGSVQSSPVGYTVASTRSNHKALYGFIAF
ncbi:hypothetical protein QEZ54_30135 [Catellatospora sp. KI3]|uniref:hypothetical protein n=1 Tax=Catellatospora sp. KI3 TaxID=3041620 RepID=UPI00248244FD|nr:hypothetical protein [Catellatospora sp. KI3]MDI1465236.1 hypothetical protein [Catellatospora sp. KI3]